MTDEGYVSIRLIVEDIFFSSPTIFIIMGIYVVTWFIIGIYQ